MIQNTRVIVRPCRYIDHTAYHMQTQRYLCPNECVKSLELLHFLGADTEC